MSSFSSSLMPPTDVSANTCKIKPYKYRPYKYSSLNLSLFLHLIFSATYYIILKVAQGSPCEVYGKI